MTCYEKIQKAIEDGEVKDVVYAIKDAIGQLYSPENILNDGIIRGIEIVAEKFREDKLLVPEVILSTRALHVGLKTIKPYLKKTSHSQRMKVVIGTVSGDLHDIGKNIIKIVISTMDIEVIDLGIDVSVEAFVAAVKKEKPEVLMLSALLTTTINQMKFVIEAINREGLHDNLAIFVGGAPVTEEFAKDIGADFYTGDSGELKEILERKIKKLKK